MSDSDHETPTTATTSTRRADKEKADNVATQAPPEEVRSWNLIREQREKMDGLAAMDTELGKKLAEIYVPRITDIVKKGDSNTPTGDMDTSDDADNKGDSNTPIGDMDTSDTSDGENQNKAAGKSTTREDTGTDTRMHEEDNDITDQETKVKQPIEDDETIYEDIQMGRRRVDDLQGSDRRQLIPQRPVDEKTSDSIITSSAVHESHKQYKQTFM